MGHGLSHGGAAAHGTASLHGGHAQGSAASEATGQTSGHPIIHAHLPSVPSTADQTHLTQIVTPARVSVLRFVLSTLSPFSLSVFLAFFGITGLFIYFFMPSLGFWTMPPAVIISFVITRQVLFALSWMVAKMQVSSEAKMEDIIGQIATVCLSIEPGHTGEVTYVVGANLYNSPAKAADNKSQYKKGSKVIICELRDNIVYVELLTDAEIVSTESAMPP
jgi:membrane protein implicated in regulation of membrane protease activity